MTGETIQLDHGVGGGCSRELVDELIAPRLGAERPRGMGEAAVLELEAARTVVASDAFVVDPIFFGNGDIGRLAVCGTVNELAASGATPRYLTLSLVIEEGLPVAALARVLDSVRASAAEAEVEVVAGETQVVRSGEADKLFLGTAGVGEFTQPPDLGVGWVRPGDAVIVTGGLGEHGIHILSLRGGGGLGVEGVLSDCAPLGSLVWNVLEDYAPQVHCMCALARGGLAGVLNELADGAGVAIEVEEHRLPVAHATRAAAGRLGVDPLCLPSEGCICVVVEGAAAADVLELIRWQPQGRDAQIVGAVGERGVGGGRGVGERGGESGRGVGGERGAVTMVRPDGGGRAVVERRGGAELSRLR
jgi:hydrogenase expression/formation protein HypE